MIKPVFRVVGLDHATCDADYCGTETATKPASTELFAPRLFSPEVAIAPPTVSVRVRDFIPALQQAIEGRLAWINDFADDTVVIPQDLHDVLVTFQRLKRAA
jgi:hypothetical protein